jgi:hypothetical protein
VCVCVCVCVCVYVCVCVCVYSCLCVFTNDGASVAIRQANRNGVADKERCRVECKVHRCWPLVAENSTYSCKSVTRMFKECCKRVAITL